MELQISSDTIQEALRVIGRLAPPTSGSVSIESDGKKLWMHSDSDASRCTVHMPAAVSGKGRAFAIGYDALRDATKGRKDLSVAYDKTLFKIKAGSFSIDLATSDALKLEHDEEKKETPIKFTQEQGTWLKSAVANVALKPNALTNAFMPVSVKLTEKGAFVTCYDTNHVAYIRSKEIKGDIEVTLPIETMTAILDTFSSGPFQLEIGRANLYVSSKMVKVVLSLPQTEDGEGEGESVTLKDVMSAANEAMKTDGHDLEVPKQEVLNFLDNARAIATKERGDLSIAIKEGKMVLGITTVNGSAKAKLKVAASKVETSVKVDYEFIDEAVRKSNDTLNMKIVADSFILFQRTVGEGKMGVMVSLNQD